MLLIWVYIGSAIRDGYVCRDNFITFNQTFFFFNLTKSSWLLQFPFLQKPVFFYYSYLSIGLTRLFQK